MGGERETWEQSRKKMEIGSDTSKVNGTRDLQEQGRLKQYLLQLNGTKWKIRNLKTT